jgi:SAM-dependent methyltransferase
MTFDSLAPTYDADFTHTRSAQLLRARVHHRLLKHLRAGDHVLELGCGTGEDALFLAQSGIYVTATDDSPAMLETTRAKIADHPLVTLQSLNLSNLPPTEQASNPKFNLIFANFGVLNVLPDWRPLAAWLAQQLPSGGIAAFGVMSSTCLWEIAWHGAHGDFRTATRRLRKSASFRPVKNAEAMAIYYPSIRRLTRDFAPYFRRTHVEGLGLFLPPSDVYAVIERRPRLFALLAGLEGRFAHLPMLAGFADHYWIEFTRK